VQVASLLSSASKPAAHTRSQLPLPVHMYQGRQTQTETLVEAAGASKLRNVLGIFRTSACLA